MVLIALVVFVVYKNKGDHTTTIDRAESNFKIEDISTIGRIILTQKNGLRSDLKRVEDHWVVNDMHRVRQSNIDHLLNGIQTAASGSYSKQGGYRRYYSIDGGHWDPCRDL